MSGPSPLVDFAFTWMCEDPSRGLCFKQGAEGPLKDAMKTAFGGADRRMHIGAMVDLVSFLLEKKYRETANQLLQWTDAVLREPTA